jgi:hypothetical protein
MSFTEYVLWAGLAIKNPPNKTQKTCLKKPKKPTSKRVLLGFFELKYIFVTKITIFHVI